MKKRITLVVAVVAVVALVAFMWKRRSDAEHTASTASATVGTASASGSSVVIDPGGATGAPTVATKRSPWLAQTGAPGRRIAGRVLSQGAPVVGARVRLGNVTTQAGGARVGEELAAVSSGPDGMFDFGIQPAAIYAVSAEFSDKTPASLIVETSNPLARPAPDHLVLSLEACHSRLNGTIVDASGGGIAKARLSVSGLGGTEASASGEYSLCVPLGDSRLRVVADGYGALDMPIHLVGALKRDFELVPEAVLTGVVVDEAGKPVPHARVLAVPQAIEQPHFLGEGTTMADADGRFRIPNLAPGRFLLAATTDGLGTAAPKSAVATPGTGAEVTLVVTTRARVSGKVMMKDQAIAGARVSVIRPGLLANAAYSQSDGSFTLDNVPLGTARLDAGTYQIVTPKELAVAKPQVDNVVIEVSEMATLRGKVLRKGNPVADAVVVLFTGPNGLNGRTDEKGEYEIRGLPGGSVQGYAQVFGESPSFAPPAQVQLNKGGVPEFDRSPSGAAMISGTVVDEAGNPVPNVYVRYINPTGDLGESMTDAKGEFSCTSMLGGGEYRPAVFPSPGSRTAFPPAQMYAPINLVDGEAHVKGVTIAIKNNRLAISGRVLDDSGQAVADVHVEAIGRGIGGDPSMLPSVRADQSGAFTIGDLAPGAYALHAHAADGSEVEVPEVPAGTKGVELRLVKPGSIEGVLAGFATPPRVHARQITSQLSIGNEAVIEGTSFSITGLTPGKYIVEALGTDENAGQSVTIKAGQVAHVKLENKGKGTLNGTVVEFGTNTPLAGFACVAAQSIGGQAGDVAPGVPTPQNTTDAKGAFSIPAPIGKARVMCFSGDGSFGAAGGDVDVAAGAPATITLKAVKALPPPSHVGYRIKPLTLPLVIASVDAGGPAEKGGLRVGDLVTSVDGQSVEGLLPAGAMMLAWNHRPGTTLTVGITRAGSPMSIKIVVAEPEN